MADLPEGVVFSAGQTGRSSKGQVARDRMTGIRSGTQWRSLDHKDGRDHHTG